MAVICPTVLASDSHDFQSQINKILPFAKRIQIDLTDGIFAASPTVALEQVWWPESVQADLHLMYKEPEKHIKEIERMRPAMAIVHAEADGVFVKIANELHRRSIKVGVALLPKTSTHIIKPSLDKIDHVLIFSGDLGKFGGIADMALLKKVTQLKEWKPDIEIGWDGGINDTNTEQLMKGGVDVLNVGGFIQKAVEPQDAYQKLTQILSQA